MKYLVIAFLFFSCTKSIDNTPVTHQNNNVLNSSNLVQDLGNTIVSISLEPLVQCYSYQNGEIPKPCDIFVYATVKLSKPIDSRLKIELIRQNLNDYSSVIMIIAPNTASVVLNTGFQNQNNQDVPDIMRIRNIAVIPPND